MELTISKEASLIGLIAEHCSSRPYAVAASYGDKRLTYGELECRSSLLARLLQSRGISRGDRVVVLTPRCLEMIICFCAILKACACYVPLDADSLSQNRITQIIQHVQPAIAVVIRAGFDVDCPTLLWLEVDSATSGDWQHANFQLQEFESQEPQPDDLAYIIYTSGTTSNPKGVMIPHRALLNYVQQGDPQTPFNMGVTPLDKVLLLFSPAFDACTGVIFSTLCNGGSLVIASADSLNQCLENCTILPCTPSILRSIGDPNRYESLRAIFFGGEAPTMDLVSLWSSLYRSIYNCYGPSETTCASLIARLLPNRPITLGLPMSNSEILLFDLGAYPSDEGEIWISGPGLAIGYLNDELLTSERFICRNGTRWYRTGDFAKRQQGELHFLGREDSLIKNRGFLVNIETEIIPALLSQDGVKSATAVHHSGKLVGFITPGNREPTQIRLSMSQHFSSYQVPDLIFCLDELPLSPNGKIEIHALRQIVQHFQGNNPDTLPNDTKLAILKSSVAKSLGLQYRIVDESASFWALGGNSLSAIQLLSELRAQDLTVSISQLLGSTTLLTLCPLLLPCQHLMSIEEESNESATFTMTAAQKRMLATLSRNPLYNHLLLTIDIPGGLSDLQAARFHNGWERLLKRHPILTSSFDIDNQLFYKTDVQDLKWQTVTARSCNLAKLYQRHEHHMLSEMQSLLTADMQTSFRLTRGPGQKAVLSWLVHHSRIDGWSMKVVFEELQAILDDRPLPGAPQFSQAAIIQNSIQDRKDKAAEAFWKDILELHSRAKPLCFTRTPSSHEYNDKSEAFTYATLSSPSMLETCRQLEVSSSAVFYAAWAVTLMHYSNADTATFGVVFSGRNLPMNGAEHVVGPMINVCPFPVYSRGNELKNQWLRGIQSQLDHMTDMQWSADRYISQFSRDTGVVHYDTLLSVQLDTSSIEWCCETVPGPWKVDQVQISEFPWTLLIEPERQKLKFRLLYQPTVATYSLTRRALSHFENVLLALLNPAYLTLRPVRESLLSTGEVQTLTQANQGPLALPLEHTSIKAAFEVVVREHPDLVAVERAAQRMTYQELNEGANRVAQKLMPRARPGTTVAVLSDGSTDWIIGVLAVIITGALYCPIDVHHSRERIERMITISQAIAVLVPNRRFGSLLSSYKDCCVLATREVLELSDHAIRSVSRYNDVMIDDPVCLIFTSGTSGTPKGVQATNRGLLSYLSYRPARLHSAPRRKIAQVFSVGFDACVAEVFGTLCYGATLLLKVAEDPLIHLRRADAAMMTPSFLSTCEPGDFPNLDTIVLGGEAVPPRLADTWARGRRLYNGYGPCECTVGSLFKELAPESEITLGRPIPGMNAYILNDNQDLMPVGIAGEIYLSGDQVVGSYFVSEDKDKGRFLPDPWRPKKTMFRTGDLGRWNESLEIEYLGRKDREVKLRGFRINLEEIENVLWNSCSTLKQVGVVVNNDTLTAFVCPTLVDEAQIVQSANAILPYYSIPSRFIKMERLPSTRNQKVDYRALAEYVLRPTKRKTPPSTAVACLVAQTWAEILESLPDGEQGISMEDDFIHLGGHSLLQVLLVRRLSKRFKCDVPLRTVMNHTILSDQAEALSRVIKASISNKHFQQSLTFLDWKNTHKAQEAMLSPVEVEMIKECSQFKFSCAFNISFLFHIMGEIDVLRLVSAFRHVISTTKVLRSRYVYSEGGFQRQINDSISLMEIRSVHDLEPRHFQSDVNMAFDLEKDQLLKIIFFETSSASSFLLVVSHHSIMDGTAFDLFFRSVCSHYMKGVERERQVFQPDIAAKETPLIEENVGDMEPDFLDWLNWRAAVNEKERQCFWKQYLKGYSEFSFGLKHAIDFDNTEGIFTKTISHNVTEAMVLTCSKRRISKQQLLLASTVLAQSVIYGLTDTVIGIPFSHRHEIGSERVIGLLLDRLPIRIKFSNEIKTREDFLAAVRLSDEQAVANAVPHWQIMEAIGSADPIFSLMVSLHPLDREHVFKLDRCTVTRQRLRSRGSKFPCMFEFFEQEDGIMLDLEIEYMIGLMSPAQIEQMAVVQEKALELLCEEIVTSDYESGDDMSMVTKTLKALHGRISSVGPELC